MRPKDDPIGALSRLLLWSAASKSLKSGAIAIESGAIAIAHSWPKDRYVLPA